MHSAQEQAREEGLREGGFVVGIDPADRPSHFDLVGSKVGFVYSRIAYTPCSCGNDVRITIVELRTVPSFAVGGTERCSTKSPMGVGRLGACRSMGTDGADV